MKKSANYILFNIRRRAIVCLLGATLGGFSCIASAGHPADGGLAEMAHPTVPLAENVLVPSVTFNVSTDSMDGYNLVLQIFDFQMTVPLDGIEDISATSNGLVMRGHLHLYINGKKMMRVYANAIHVPKSWMNEGINTITLSMNNHQHGTFTHQDKEVQSTVIIDTRSQDKLVKSIYNWPKS